MFEPLTLRMPELAERWKMTPVQALEFADVNGLPIYFNFSGLAFFDSNEWCRTHGDQDTRRELGKLESDITNGELHILRHARGETGKYDHLTDQDARNLRQSIEASKHRCKIINELLEQREIDRKRYLYRGPIGAGQKTLFEIQQSGKSGWPRFGMPPGRTDLIPLEYLSDSGYEPLTMESLFVVLREVKAAESYFKAKQPDTQPQAATPTATVVEAPAREPVQWKMRIQIEAAAHIKTLRAAGASPTPHSILDRMVTWCRDNKVMTDGDVYPSAGYLRTHVLGGKHWMPPR